MIYALVTPNEIFTKTMVEVKENFIGKTNLWTVNQGELLLLQSQNESSFLREIGVVKGMEKVNYKQFSVEEMTKIFMHYYQRGEIVTIKTRGNRDDEEEVNDFVRNIRFGKMPDEEETMQMKEEYEYLMENMHDWFWYFVIRKNTNHISIYSSGIIDVEGISIDENLAILVYREILELFQQPFVVSEVELREKEKVDHHMKNAAALMEGLFRNYSSEDASKQLEISLEEYESIKKELMTYTKEFTTKKVYK